MYVPHRYDLDKTSCVNKEVEAYSRKLRKLMEALDNTVVVNVDLDRSFFTKHGQHMNAKGKEVMAIKIVTAIKNILKVHRKSPISMKWKEDQNKENPTTTTTIIIVVVIVVPWLRQSVAGLSTNKSRFNPRTVHVKFKVDIVVLRQVLLICHQHCSVPSLNKILLSYCYYYYYYYY